MKFFSWEETERMIVKLNIYKYFSFCLFLIWNFIYIFYLYYFPCAFFRSLFCFLAIILSLSFSFSDFVLSHLFPLLQFHIHLLFVVLLSSTSIFPSSAHSLKLQLVDFPWAPSRTKVNRVLNRTTDKMTNSWKRAKAIKLKTEKKQDEVTFR